MSTNILGIRNSNTIIPLTASTRRTKEVALTVTSAQAGWATDRATGIFYCDSSATPVWRLRFNVSGTFNSASVQTITAAITGVLFKSTVGQAIAANFPVANSTVRAFANGNTGDLVASMASAASTANVTYSGDVELNAEPIAYTTAANMEGVVAVDVFVPEATATVAGIVGTVAQTIAGDKTLTGFTSLGGDVALKCKRILATFPNGSPYYGFAAHGLDGSKIVMVSFLADQNSPNSDTASNIAYRGYFGASYVVWYGASTGSVTLYTKSCEALVWYIA